METTEICTQRSAQELLAEFKTTGRQEPFEEIVRRYAGMVYHVCLQVTKNTHDAEDATQAVFLTLAVQAKTEKEIRCLGPWLQQVGHRLSLDLRKSKKRRQAREEKHGLIQQYTHPAYEQPIPLDQEELRAVINEELNKLPAKYRLPLILHYFGGLSREAMARELHLKPGTLGARLHRGRAMLGERLAERGVVLAEASLGMALAYSVQTSVTDALIATTCQAATQYATYGDLNIGVLPIQVVGLVRNAVRAAIYSKLKTIGVLLLAAGTAVAAGAEVVARARPLDLRFNLPTELGERILPLVQPLPKPSFSDATLKAAPGRTNPKDDGLADQATRGLLQEGGSPGLHHYRFEPGSTLSSLGGSAWHGVPFGGGADIPMSYAFGGSNVHSAPAAMTGPRLNGSADISATGSSFKAWYAQDFAPRNMGSVLPRRALDSLQGGFVTARPQGRVVQSGAQPGRFNLNGSGDGETRPQGYVNKPRPKPSDIGGPTFPLDPPVVQNPLPIYPPAQPGQPPVVPGKPQVLTPAPVAPPGGDVVASRDVVLIPPVASQVSNPMAMSYPSRTVIVTPEITASIPSDGAGTWAVGVSNSTSHWTENPAIARYALDSALLEFDVIAPQVFHASNDARLVFQTQSVDPYVPLDQGRYASSPNLLQGYGVATRIDAFDQSGQVIADGYGFPRTLDLSRVRAIENRIDNPWQRGTNGWFAKRGGRLTLPPLDVDRGTNTYTWGEENSDPTIDLVNSVRVRLTDVTNAEPVSISLLALDLAGTPGVPELPAGHTFIGLWEFKAPNLLAGGIDLTVRYDDGLAQELSLNEMNLKLWRYDHGSWEIIQDSPQNLALNLITGHTESLTYFAVSTPEPSGMLIFATGVLFLARRRRRH